MLSALAICKHSRHCCMHTAHCQITLHIHKLCTFHYLTDSFFCFFFVSIVYRSHLIRLVCKIQDKIAFLEIGHKTAHSVLTTFKGFFAADLILLLRHSLHRFKRFQSQSLIATFLCVPEFFCRWCTEYRSNSFSASFWIETLIVDKIERHIKNNDRNLHIFIFQAFHFVVQI